MLILNRHGNECQVSEALDGGGTTVVWLYDRLLADMEVKFVEFGERDQHQSR